MLTDMWEPERDFAWLKLPHANIANLCAISKYGAPSLYPGRAWRCHLVAATAPGFLFASVRLVHLTNRESMRLLCSRLRMLTLCVPLISRVQLDSACDGGHGRGVLLSL